jgi:hypothetical protein
VSVTVVSDVLIHLERLMMKILVRLDDDHDAFDVLLLLLPLLQRAHNNA